MISYSFIGRFGCGAVGGESGNQAATSSSENAAVQSLIFPSTLNF
jgi:hypothetical protein